MSGIDLGKVQKKLNRLEGNNNVYWKPDMDTQHEIRILLPQDGTNDPFKEYHLHYEVSDSGGFLCPQRNFDEECPVCDLANELYEEGKEKESEEHMDLAKDLWPSQRYYSPVVEVGEEDKGAAWYGYSKTVYKELLKYALDSDYRDLTDLKDSHNIKVEKTKSGGQMYPRTSIDPSPKRTALGSSDEERERLKQSIPDLESALTTKEEQEIQDLLDEYMMEQQEGMTEEEEKYGGDDEPADDVEEAFDELNE